MSEIEMLIAEQRYLAAGGSIEHIIAVRLYTSQAKKGLAMMALLASIAERPRHAHIWTLLDELLGYDEYIEKIHRFLMELDKERKEEG